MKKIDNKSGYTVDHEARAAHRVASEQKRLAVYLIEKLEQRGGRTTNQLMGLLETVSKFELSHAINSKTGETWQTRLNQKQFNAVVGIARRFVRQHENGDIYTQASQINNKTVFSYWLISDPRGIIKKILLSVKSVLAITRNGGDLLDIVSGYSLVGEEANAVMALEEFIRVLQPAAELTKDRIKLLLPDLVDEVDAAQQLTPPLEERLGLPPSQPASIWDEAKRRSVPQKSFKAQIIDSALDAAVDE